MRRLFHRGDRGRHRAPGLFPERCREGLGQSDADLHLARPRCPAGARSVRKSRAMNTTYRGNPEAVRALVQPDRVHRDLYINPEIFELEQEHFFANTWSYVGHDSQIPKPGDYIT